MEILSTISHITSMHISFHQKLDSIQYNAALAITGAIRGTSREKVYHELGFEPPLSAEDGVVNFVAFITV